MSIVFLIPVKHQESVDDYKKTWELLTDTLHSIAAQTVPYWHVIVIANKVGPIPPELPSNKITFIELKQQYSSPANWSGHLIDKANKRRSGIITSIEQRMNPTWYFMGDADDLVADDMVATIMSTVQEHHKIVTIDSGVVVDKKEQEYIQIDNLNEVCGTSIAIRSSLIHDSLDDGGKLGSLLGQYKFYHFHPFCNFHQRHSLGLIPRVAYLRHEQNYSSYAPLVDASRLTDEIRSKFSILT